MPAVLAPLSRSAGLRDFEVDVGSDASIFLTLARGARVKCVRFNLECHQIRHGAFLHSRRSPLVALHPLRLHLALSAAKNGPVHVRPQTLHVMIGRSCGSRSDLIRMFAVRTISPLRLAPFSIICSDKTLQSRRRESTTTMTTTTSHGVFNMSHVEWP